MPTLRLQLIRLVCDRPSTPGGDYIEITVYEGAEGNPTRWLWTSGEEIMSAGDRWEIDGTTPNFSARLWVSLTDRSYLLDPWDVSSHTTTCSYGRFMIDASDAATVATTDTNSPWTQFTWHGAHYTFVYRILAAQAVGTTTPSADPNLDVDLSMLKNGSRQPLTTRLRQIRSVVTNNNVLQDNVLKLARLCRKAVIRYERERLERYLRVSNDTHAQKTTTACQLARDVARMEFLLGWMYHRGYGARRYWETNNANRGPFPDVYLHEVGNTMARVGDREWCTSFNGTTYRWLGFDVLRANNAANEARVFWSGYRLQHWGRTGQNVNGTHLGDAINTARGGAVVHAQRDSRWVNATSLLPNNLITWRTLWDNLQARGLQPQPGDILLMSRYGHTVMVDDVEASGNDFWVYTIEGNADHAVRSRRINLRANSDSRTYRQRTRRCLAANTNACVSPPPGTAQQDIRREHRRQFGIALIRPGWDNFAEETPPGMQAIVASDDAQNGSGNVISFETIAPAGELLGVILSELKTFMSSATLPNGPWIQNPNANRVYEWCGRPAGNMSIT